MPSRCGRCCPAAPPASCWSRGGRRRRAWRAVRLLHLDVLSLEEATTLLGRIAGRERVATEPDAAADLVHRCGRLPLAVRIAGARLLARPMWSLRDLADSLADATRRLEALQIGDVAVRASFDGSLRALGESPDPGDRAAASAFGLIALPDGPDLAVDAAASLLDQPAVAVQALLERLVDAQLLDASRPGRYRFHDLVRVYARAHVVVQHGAPVRAAALGRAMGFWLASAWKAAALLPSGAGRLAAPGGGNTTGGRRFADAAEALGWLEAERPNLLAAVAQAAADALSGGASLPSELTGQLAAALYAFFEMRSYWHDQAQVNQTALHVARHAEDPAGQALALNDLGMALDRLGRYEEGSACLLESLAISRQRGDRRGEATSLFHLGLGQVWRGRYEEAMAGLREALALFRETDDGSGQADALRTIASIHGRLGQFAEATGHLDESLAISRRLGDRLSEAAALTNLGIVHRHLGRLEEAASSLRESLSIFRGFGHRGQVNSLHDLGLAYGRMGRHQQALDCLREALLLVGELGNRRGQALVLRDLGDAFQAVGRAVGVTLSGCVAHQYIAYISLSDTHEVPSGLQATSNSSWVVWGASVSVAASPNPPNQIQTVAVTATSCFDVGPTPYFVSLYEVVNGQLVKIAFSGSGFTASDNVGPDNPNELHTFVAMIDSPAIAVSNPVFVTWP
ncbi:MAG TPA: tetratricopeptide repeat protein [Candidatus Dormibacteraeota bacterium]|nr:tetratricopeptide repeat protein [Candidatus Dormibacteraeota bacterium]